MLDRNAQAGEVRTLDGQDYGLIEFMEQVTDQIQVQGRGGLPLGNHQGRGHAAVVHQRGRGPPHSDVQDDLAS